MLGVLVVVCLAVSACSQLGETAGDLRERLDGIDLREAVGNLSDCDTLSDTFVGLVGTAADTIDGLAAATDGRVPQTDIRRTVDGLAVNQYYEIAEQLGCARVQMELQLVNRILDIDTESPAGEDFLNRMVEEVQQQ